MEWFPNSYKNAVCEVRDVNNELLLTGRIRSVSECEDTSETGGMALEIVALNGEPLPPGKTTAL